MSCFFTIQYISHWKSSAHVFLTLAGLKVHVVMLLSSGLQVHVVMLLSSGLQVHVVMILSSGLQVHVVMFLSSGLQVHVVMVLSSMLQVHVVMILSSGLQVHFIPTTEKHAFFLSVFCKWRAHYEIHDQSLLLDRDAEVHYLIGNAEAALINTLHNVFFRCEADEMEWITSKQTDISIHKMVRSSCSW